MEPMKLVTYPIDTLISPEYNPRKKLTAEDSEYQKIMNSLQRFGYVDPVVVNKRTMHLVGGNQRWQVLKDLGYETIECVEVDLDPLDEKACNVALNKISGEWDNFLLRDLLQELKDADFDIDLTGFNELEFDQLATSLTFEENGSIDDYKEPENEIYRCPKCGHEDAKAHFKKV